jgi:UDP-N-acetylmuramyl pentapeptide phosphotransferase/UDP-N-acetylglucosamine-1-phosphate transferase
VTAGLRRAAAGAVTARVSLWVLRDRPPGGVERWQRLNYRGKPVSLLGGPSLAVAAATSTAAPPAAGVAGLGACLVGMYDDHHGDLDHAKGFRGHLAAARRGRLTGGVVKLVGIAAVGVLSGALLAPRRPRDVLLAGAVIAGSANLLNLLDVRPGRALKVGALAGAALGQPGIVGSCAALLPDDLQESSMLGDAGANALGAVLGVALLCRVTSHVGRLAALAGLVTLTGASEVVSFSDVIERSPSLRRLDRMGRRP